MTGVCNEFRAILVQEQVEVRGADEGRAPREGGVNQSEPGQISQPRHDAARSQGNPVMGRDQALLASARIYHQTYRVSASGNARPVTCSTRHESAKVFGPE